jgi:hypothetical protein
MVEILDLVHNCVDLSTDLYTEMLHTVLVKKVLIVHWLMHSKFMEIISHGCRSF